MNRYSGLGARMNGMSIIEAMIALLIGAFLMGGILQISITGGRLYRTLENISRLQENARLILDVLSNDIQNTGFTGCNSKLATLNNDINNPSSNYLYNFGTPIQGFDASSTTTWTPSLDSSIAATTGTSSPIGGSDVLSIRKANISGYSLTATGAIGASSIITDGPTSTLTTDGLLTSGGANNCATVVVSDCSSSEAFQVSGITSNTSSSTLKHATSGCLPGNSGAGLANAYAVGASVYPINTISYYLLTDPGGYSGFYRRIGTAAAQELAEGVQQMQILYGLDTDAVPDGTPNYYIPAGSALDWSKVVSVKISLLMATLDDNLSNLPVPYTYNGTTVTPTDHKLRRVLNTTIAIRNQLL